MQWNRHGDHGEARNTLSQNAKRREGRPKRREEELNACEWCEKVKLLRLC